MPWKRLLRHHGVMSELRRITTLSCTCVTSRRPYTAATPFLFFALPFLLLRSRGFSVVMPALHTSAYFSKNAGRASGDTMVEILTRLVLRSFDLPFVARMSIGSGVAGLVSANAPSWEASGSGWSYESLFCIKNMEPWSLPLVLSKTCASCAKNSSFVRTPIAQEIAADVLGGGVVERGGARPRDVCRKAMNALQTVWVIRTVLLQAEYRCA